MLKKKLKECRKCHRDKVIWSDGMCKECTTQSNFDRETSFGMATKAQLKRTPFPVKALKKKLKKTRKKNPEKKKFFQQVIERNQHSPVSFESGKNLGTLDAVNIAHIFPKQIYKSIAYNHRNIILLSWEEHTRFDDLLLAHDFETLEQEFNSWEGICNKIKILTDEGLREPDSQILEL